MKISICVLTTCVCIDIALFIIGLSLYFSSDVINYRMDICDVADVGVISINSEYAIGVDFCTMKHFQNEYLGPDLCGTVVCKENINITEADEQIEACYLLYKNNNTCFYHGNVLTLGEYHVNAEYDIGITFTLFGIIGVMFGEVFALLHFFEKFDINDKGLCGLKTLALWIGYFIASIVVGIVLLTPKFGNFGASTTSCSISGAEVAKYESGYIVKIIYSGPSLNIGNFLICNNMIFPNSTVAQDNLDACLDSYRTRPSACYNKNGRIYFGIPYANLLEVMFGLFMTIGNIMFLVFMFYLTSSNYKNIASRCVSVREV